MNPNMLNKSTSLRMLVTFGKWKTFLKNLLKNGFRTSKYNRTIYVEKNVGRRMWKNFMGMHFSNSRC
jgi:hypothetical protein